MPRRQWQNECLLEAPIASLKCRGSAPRDSSSKARAREGTPLSSVFKPRTIGPGFVCPPCSPDRAVPDRATGMPSHSRLEWDPSPARSSVKQALRFNETRGFLERWSMSWSWRRSISLGPVPAKSLQVGSRHVVWCRRGSSLDRSPWQLHDSRAGWVSIFETDCSPPTSHQATPAPTKASVPPAAWSHGSLTQSSGFATPCVPAISPSPGKVQAAAGHVRVRSAMPTTQSSQLPGARQMTDGIFPVQWL